MQIATDLQTNEKLPLRKRKAPRLESIKKAETVQYTLLGCDKNLDDS